MKNKSSKLLLTLLFLLTLCGFAYGGDTAVMDVVIIGPANGTEFNSTDDMNMTFFANLTHTTINNCSLYHIDLGNDTITHVGSINVPNITDSADFGVLTAGNYSGITPTLTTSFQRYESFMLQILCNDTAAGNQGDAFNISSMNYTYEFNGRPTNVSAAVNGDYTMKGQDKTFTINWDDFNGTFVANGIWGYDVSNATVCSTDQHSWSGGCVDTTYVTTGLTSFVENTTTLTYTVPMTMAGGSHEAYIFISDDGGLVSSSYYIPFKTSGGMTQQQQKEFEEEIEGRALAVAAAGEDKEGEGFFDWKIIGFPVWLGMIFIIAFGVFMWKTKK